MCILLSTEEIKQVGIVIRTLPISPLLCTAEFSLQRLAEFVSFCHGEKTHSVGELGKKMPWVSGVDLDKGTCC
jgi:hypothetical protein